MIIKWSTCFSREGQLAQLSSFFRILKLNISLWSDRLERSSRKSMQVDDTCLLCRLTKKDPAWNDTTTFSTLLSQIPLVWTWPQTTTRQAANYNTRKSNLPPIEFNLIQQVNIWSRHNNNKCPVCFQRIRMIIQLANWIPLSASVIGQPTSNKESSSSALRFRVADRSIDHQVQVQLTKLDFVLQSKTFTSTQSAQQVHIDWHAIQNNPSESVHWYKIKSIQQQNPPTAETSN